MRTYRWVRNLLGWVIVTVLLLVAVLIIFSKFALPGGIHLYNIDSGSMTPSLKVGTLVVVRPQNDYQVGQVITFKAQSAQTQTITHRIVDRQEKNGIIAFTTKGDANDSADDFLVVKDRVIGREILKLPYFGYFVLFAQKPLGLILLIIVPATLIIYTELNNIRREWRRLRSISPWLSAKLKSLKKEGR